MSDGTAFVMVVLIAAAAVLAAGVGLTLGDINGFGRGLEAAGRAGVVPVQCVGQSGWHLSCEEDAE